MSWWGMDRVSRAAILLSIRFDKSLRSGLVPVKKRVRNKKTGTEFARTYYVKASSVYRMGEKPPEAMIKSADSDEQIHGYVTHNNNWATIYSDGEPVGFFKPRDAGYKGYWRTGAIFIDPAHRGKGLAAKAIREFLQEKKKVMDFVDKENEASLSLFRKLNFREEYDDDMGGYWMMKDINR